METFWIALAGILATLTSSVLGLYFTAKARSSPLREQLYQRQLDIIVKLMSLIGRVRVYGPKLMDPRDPGRERARTDLDEVAAEWECLEDEIAALMPTEIYVASAQLKRLIIDFLASVDDGRPDREFPNELAGRATKVAMLSRTFLGIDKLSRETFKLFGSTKEIERLANLEHRELVNIAKNDQRRT